MGCAAPAAALASRTVLVLSGERSDLPGVQDFERGLREGLADPSGATEIFVEYLDAGRFPAPGHHASFVRYVRERYAGRRIDALVTLAESAFELVLANRAALFPGIPTVAAAVERQHVEGRTLPAGVATVPVRYDFRGTLRLASALQPDLREVVIVHGVGDYDVRRAKARLSVERHEPPLRVRLLGSKPLAAIEDEVRSLPRDSAVLFVSMVRDAEGRSFVATDYVRRLSAASPVPVYGLTANHLQNGALGGAITDFAAIGRATSAVVSRALSGEDLPEPKAADQPVTPLRVNLRSAAKWGIPAERIPPEAGRLFADQGLWETHRGMVVAAVVAFALQALLIFGLVVQLRERHRAEGALKRSEERLRLSAEAAHLGMWGWSSSSDRMWATASCRALYGLAPDRDVSFNDIIELVHPEDRPAVRRAVQDALHEHRAFFIEYRVLRPGGEVAWITSQGRGTYGGGPEPLRVLGVSADITERKRSQETVRRQQHELEHITRFSTMGQIAASLAHELSQPLGAILSNAQAGLRFLDRGALSPAELREILQEIVADDRRAGEVVAALRSMLRREKSESKVLDVAQVARDVVALLHGELVSHHVEAETAGEPGCLVLANKTQIEQVFVNLAMNAIDAMRARPPGERRLRIEVSRAADGAVRAAVRDSGPGIPPEELERVFEPFWTTKSSGMGMGLAICDTIVKSCAGTIRVEPNPGPGVTFVFTLPPA
jgi:PAS domain S-box-containing protein